jgi:ribosomal protein S18 acetylase RimI-like enzyme
MGAQGGRGDDDQRSPAAATAAARPGKEPAGLRIRAGGTADASFAGTLHAAAIADGFLSGLGPRFLAVLYRRIVLHGDSFLLVAEGDDGAPAGFIAGACAVGGLYRAFLAHDSLRAVAAAPIRLLASWRRALETLRYGGAGGSPPAPAAPEAELLAVAVTDRWRGHGLGSRLVGAFLEELRARGVARAAVVVGADNEPAIAMYRRAGFGDDRVLELHSGTPSLRLAWAASRDVGS